MIQKLPASEILWRQGNDWLLGVASGHAKKAAVFFSIAPKIYAPGNTCTSLLPANGLKKELTNPVDSGEMWECPDFFPLGKKHVLLYSTAGQVVWESGELNPKGLKFHSEKRGIPDRGAYYAQKTQLDAKGNRILWGWIPEKRPDSELLAAGWAGCMALPRTLSLSTDGELEMTITPEAQSLREKGYSLAPKNGSRDSEILEPIAMDDLRAELRWKSTNKNLALTLEDRSGPWWSASFVTASSSTTVTVNGSTFEMPAAPADGHEFHLFLDGSLAELIVNRRHAITSRIYHQPNGPLRVKIGGDSKIMPFEAWSLRPISSDRLST